MPWASTRVGQDQARWQCPRPQGESRHLLSSPGESLPNSGQHGVPSSGLKTSSQGGAKQSLSPARQRVAGLFIARGALTVQSTTIKYHFGFSGRGSRTLEHAGPHELPTHLITTRIRSAPPGACVGPALGSMNAGLTRGGDTVSLASCSAPLSLPKEPWWARGAREKAQESGGSATLRAPRRVSRICGRQVARVRPPSNSRAAPRR